MSDSSKLVITLKLSWGCQDNARPSSERDPLLQGQGEVRQGKKGVKSIKGAYKTTKKLTYKIVTPKFPSCVKQLLANHEKVQLKQNQFTNFTLSHVIKPKIPLVKKIKSFMQN